MPLSLPVSRWRGLYILATRELMRVGVGRVGACAGHRCCVGREELLPSPDTNTASRRTVRVEECLPVEFLTRLSCLCRVWRAWPL